MTSYIGRSGRRWARSPARSGLPGGRMSQVSRWMRPRPVKTKNPPIIARPPALSSARRLGSWACSFRGRRAQWMAFCGQASAHSSPPSQREQSVACPLSRTASMGQASLQAPQSVQACVVDHPAEEGHASHQAQERAERAQVTAPHAPLYPREGEDAHEHEQV